MDGRDEAVVDPLSNIARSLLESAQRVAALGDDAEHADADHADRARGHLDAAGATARTILLEARDAAAAERDMLSAKVDESHNRIRALLDELDFGRPPAAGLLPTLSLPAPRALAPAPVIDIEPVVAPPGTRLEPVVAPVPAPPPPPSIRPAGEPWSPAPWLRSLFRVPGGLEGLSVQRRRWAETFLWVRNIGIITLLFVVYQLWGTGVGQARTQRSLLRDFNAAPAAASAAEPSPTSSSPDPLPPPPAGKAVAVLKITKIGVEQAVVEGTGTADLRKGPGHYRETPLPGEHGNVAIAGHRTTYGAPFHRLDELERGDPILLATRQGVFKYLVAAKRVVSPNRNGAIQPTSDDRLTLTTCHPKYSASQRLIIIAALAPPTAAPTAPGGVTSAPASQLATPARRARPVHDLHAGGDVGALLPTIGWGLLLLLVTLRARHMAWERLERHAYLLASPVVVALLVLFFERLDHLLPPNY